jgi:hypothetical protein
MPLSPKVSVTTGGIHGRCWFANDDIKKGDKIWWNDPSITNYRKEKALTVDFQTFATWPKDKQDKFMELAYQIDENTLEGFPEGVELPEDFVKENYVNHCCDGNCWFEGDDLIVASRDIAKGEEINYDYALTETSSYFSLNCLCGKALCRKNVTGDDWKLPELQARYGNHFLPYILKLIEEHKKKL